MTDSFADELIALLPRLRRFALSLTGKRADADDLVQAACERALRARDSYEPGTRLDAWLFRIIKNLWIDQIRRRKIENSAPLPPDDQGSPSADGVVLAESRLMLGSVEAAFAGLPADQRNVLRLVCIEGLSYQETAQALAIPIGTVMSRLSRARAALLEALGEDKPWRVEGMRLER
jgi:RNA polymerase sigma-70 factor, ECF subfamily